MSDETLVAWTIGHSNTPFDDFARALDAHGIEFVIDVRRFPDSRRLKRTAALRGGMTQPNAVHSCCVY